MNKIKGKDGGEMKWKAKRVIELDKKNLWQGLNVTYCVKSEGERDVYVSGKERKSWEMTVELLIGKYL